MKKAIKILCINTAVLLVLLVLLEIALHLAGMDTIVEIEKRRPGWGHKYKRVCEKIATQEVEVYNSFYTDNEGIFRGNPEYFANAKNKNPDAPAVNRDGFRGNSFEYVETSKPKILLIGDSFTWGATAKPFSNSFADLLQQAGYYVYNSGIPGTDSQQYALIAKKYTPLLKPDVVAVCLYLGNDVSSRPLRMQPDKNLHYATNFGFLLGYDNQGNFFKDGREAFQYLKNRKCGRCSDLWSYFIFKTVVGKGVYQALHHRQYLKFDPSRQWVRGSLAEIRETCRLSGSRMMVFIIPFVNRNIQKNITIEKNLYLFKDFEYYYSGDFEKDDYQTPPDKHFNNQGHRKYADFMIRVLKQNGYGQ